MKFDEKYEKLMEQYSLNEGIFSNIGQKLKNLAITVGKTFKDAIVDPFNDPKFNPFAGKSKPIDTSESGIIINKIEEEWMDVNKKIIFKYKDENGVYKSMTFYYSQLQQKEDQTVSLFRKLSQSKK
jgi:hypothetical protein